MYRMKHDIYTVFQQNLKRTLQSTSITYTCYKPTAISLAPQFIYSRLHDHIQGIPTKYLKLVYRDLKQIPGPLYIFKFMKNALTAVSIANLLYRGSNSRSSYNWSTHIHSRTQATLTHPHLITATLNLIMHAQDKFP